MCNDSVIVGLNGGMGKTSREQLEGGKERLFMVPYFLSQHPLSSRGKSIPKVEGHSGGIPFVQPCVCVCFYLCLAFSVFTKTFGLIDFLLQLM